MNTLAIFYLLVNILMASQALCPQVAAQWLMACAALFLKVCMRLVAFEADSFTALGGDLPRAERQAHVKPKQQGKPQEEQCCHQKTHQ